MTEEPITTFERIPEPAAERAEGWTPLQTASLAVLAVLCAVLVWNAYHPEDVYFSDLQFQTIAAGQIAPQRDQSVLGRTLQIGRNQYGRGISVSPDSEIALPFIPEGYSYFMAEIGVDTNAPEDTGTVIFSVVSDGTVLYESPVLKKGMPPVQVCVPIRHPNRKSLTLKVTDAGDGAAGDYADWAIARFVYSM